METKLTDPLTCAVEIPMNVADWDNVPETVIR